MPRPSTPRPDAACIDALATAIVAGVLGEVRSLLATTPQLAAARVPSGRSMLHVATDWPGHRPRVGETVAILIAAGADANARFLHPNGEARETPLHWAASCDDVEAVTALLDGGAEVDATGGVIGDCAPFEEAIIFQQYGAASFLLERGATPYLPGIAALGHLDLVAAHFDSSGELRTDRPLLPNWETMPPQQTLLDRAFQFASRAGHLEVAQFLLARGADPDAMTPVGTTARQEAAGNGHGAVTSWLDSLGSCVATLTPMPDATPLLEMIRSSVIGRSELVEGPFGPRPVVYADYTASGRSLSFIEDYISDVVLPLYANTHTESSGTGLQTTRFREDARAIIADCLGAGDDHAVLFCGSGSTGAIAKMVGVLGLRIPSVLDDAHHLSDQIPAEQRPVVFLGPYEHHSNELPWRESIADVVTIDEDHDGHVDLQQLERELERHRDRPQLIGSFSAASNVTGIVTDTAAVSSLLHHHGAIALWDFAAAAPYVDIDMGSPADGDDYYDAIFVSPHKLIGGPGTPGLLVARRDLFANRVPDVPGGGTVAYVNPTEHDYFADVEHREEGGTPDIVGSIRAGLIFQLKEAVGIDTIAAREERFVRRAIETWGAHPNLMILGSREAERLSIVSFMVRDEGTPPGAANAHYLHHNFVVGALNDVFGIQARGGCSCAGPYGHRLLGIDLDRSHEFEREITRGCEGIKPGWVRVNFNYFISDETFEYIVDAVALLADQGRKLLPYYRFEPDTGLWRHRDGVSSPPLSLRDISYDDGSMQYHRRPHLLPEGGLPEYLDRARDLLAALEPLPPLGLPATTSDFEHLRWFPYPDEA